MTKKAVPFIQSIVLLAFAWLLFIGISFFLNHNSNQVLFSVPKTATFQVQFDTKKLLDDASFNLLIDQEKDGLNDVFYQLIQDKTGKEDIKLIAGIDIFNHITYFLDDFNGEQVQGLIFTLNNTQLWDKNGEKLVAQHSYSQRKEVSGLLLFSDNLSKQELKKYASKSDFNSYKSKPNKESLIELEYQPKETGYFQQLKSSFDYKDNKITSKGSFHLDNKANKSEFNIEPSYFHLKTSIIPQNINDTLHFFTQQVGLELPNIHSIAMNYQGIELVQTDNGMIPLPLADMIFEFDEAYSIAGNLSRLAITENTNFKFSKTFMTLEIGKKIYYCKQLSPKAIYIGLSKKPKINKNTSSPIEAIGNPNALLNIKGSQWIVGMIKMNENYSAVENLLINLNSIEFSSHSNSDHSINYLLNVEFIKNKKALNEVLKLLLK